MIFIYGYRNENRITVLHRIDFRRTQIVIEILQSMLYDVDFRSFRLHALCK